MRPSLSTPLILFVIPLCISAVALANSVATVCAVRHVRTVKVAAFKFLDVNDNS